jgi:hypothetical protein
MTDEGEKSWSGILAQLGNLEREGKWLFRGDTADILQTGLERACASWPDPHPDPAKTERSLLKDFRRRYPAWNSWTPPSTDTLEWLALMQHYGAPTRLLDCTYSPFIAAFFALQKLLLSTHNQAFVWVFRASWFRQIHSQLPSDSERKALDHVANNQDGVAFEELFLRAEPIRFVYPVNPRTLNERLVLQQGVFLCPGDVTASFEANLRVLEGAEDPNNVQRLVIHRSDLRVGLQMSLRMNLDEATLFPGLQGYAGSLRTRLAFLADMGL